jgi:DmsE family decaheme c-type cytochrome
MKSIRWLFALLLALHGFDALAQPGEESAQYIGEGECKTCHKNQDRSYLAGKHGRVFAFNPSNDKEAGGCETCHGPGSGHVQVVGGLDYSGPLHIRAFKDRNTADEDNKVCMGCHENGARMHWRNSAHAGQGVLCTTCHTIHGESPVPTMDICVDCHKAERARLQRSEHMPLREKKVTCMDCHNPHGGIGPGSLKTASVNEACYQCHTEKRGPNIFEHPPVREDCTNCHDPHGSNNGKLLKKKLPYLCQECHSVRFHPADLYDGADLGNAAVKQLRGKACINCHSQIHGSNHPAGARFQR